MSAAKEKAPTRQRQGFGVNHYEAIHMANTTAVQGGGQQLVRVFSGVIGGLPAQVCDGRELHAFLKNGKQFSDWIKLRIKQYGFEENQDFRCFSPKSEKPQGERASADFQGFSVKPEKPQGGRPGTDYHLSLDMAKELSMVENNEQGRTARRYFIAMERERHALVNPPPALANPEAGVKTIRHVFEGRPISFAMLNDKPWVCAANICTALNLGSSDRVTRSLPANQKRRIQRGATQLWMIDAAAAVRAADYCRNDPDRADRYRQWMSGVLTELAGAPMEGAGLNDKDLACLFALCKGMDAVRRAHDKLRPVLEAMGSNHLHGVYAALETFEHGTAHLRRRFARGMAKAAQASGLADECMSANLLGVKLEEALAVGGQALQGEYLQARGDETEAESAVRKLLATNRFMCTFDLGGQLAIKEVPNNAVVIADDRLARYIGDPEGPPRATLVDILEAVSQRMKTLH